MWAALVSSFLRNLIFLSCHPRASRSQVQTPRSTRLPVPTRCLRYPVSAVAAAAVATPAASCATSATATIATRYLCHTASAVVVAAVSAPTAVVAAAPLVCQSPSTPLPLPPPRAPSPNKSRATGTCHHASFLTCTGYRLTLTGKLDSLKDFPGRNRRTRATAWDARRPRTQTSPRPATAHRRAARRHAHSKEAVSIGFVERCVTGLHDCTAGAGCRALSVSPHRPTAPVVCSSEHCTLQAEA